MSRDPTPPTLTVQPPTSYRTWSSDQSELTPLTWVCLSAECTRNPRAHPRTPTDLELQRMCAQNNSAFSFAFLFPSTTSRFISACWIGSRGRRSNKHGEQYGCSEGTANPVATVKGPCPPLHHDKVAGPRRGYYGSLYLLARG